MDKIIKNFTSFITDIIETIVIALAIFLVVYILLVQPHRVSGDSMLPNFENGELILTDKVSYKFGQPKRGDVIVFKAPPDKKKDFIKRIVGLPGEKVSLKDGKFYVNDQSLFESYLQPDIKVVPGSFLKEGEQKQIPADNYFVMGDNRSHSYDSREWGFLARQDIIGRAWLIYWPPDMISIISKTNY